MQLLIVMYHYIDDEDKYQRGVYPVSLERLERQIELIGKNFQFICEADLVKAIRGEKALPESSAYLSFDDGLKSHYQRAFPLLKRKGVGAVFSVSSLPFTQKKACLVHKIHYLLTFLEPERFLQEIDSFYQEITGRPLAFKESQETVKRFKRYDEPTIGKVKFLLNHHLEQEVSQEIIDEIFKRCSPVNEQEFINKWYLSKQEIKEMSREGFSFELHTESHLNMLKISAESLERELAENLKFLENLLPQREVYGISYPYSWIERSSCQRFMEQAGGKLGLVYGLTTVSKINASLESPFLLSRFDTNDLPAGKRPIIDFS